VVRGGKYEAKGRTTNRTDTDSIKRKEDRRDTGINSQPEIIANAQITPPNTMEGLRTAAFFFKSGMFSRGSGRIIPRIKPA